MNVDHGRIQPHFEKQTNFKVIVKIEQGDKNDKSIIILFYWFIFILDLFFIKKQTLKDIKGWLECNF